MLAWAPAYLVLQLSRHGRDWRQLTKVLASLLPVSAVLVWQSLTSETLGTGMIIAPFRAWSRLSSNIPLSATRSLAFPMAFAAVYFRDVRSRADHLFAWGIFGVASVQYVMLFITGVAPQGSWTVV